MVKGEVFTNMERRPEMNEQGLEFNSKEQSSRFVPKFTLGPGNRLVFEGKARRASAPVPGTSNRKSRRR